MAVKTIPLSRLETDLKTTLSECAASGQTVVVEMPDQRRLAIQSLDPQNGEKIERFRKLVSEWKAHSGPSSSTEKLAMHPAYQQIVGMGPDVIPLLLSELERAPDHWFWALRAITGQNPVRPEHRGRMSLMAQDWLRWAENRGIR